MTRIRHEVAPPQRFEAQVAETGNGMLVRIIGELDLGSVPNAEAAIMRAEGSGAATLEIDLSTVEFLDSTGLRMLVRAQDRADAAGRSLRLRRGSSAVDRVLKLTRLDERFAFVE